jgi:hypothetical protein
MRRENPWGQRAYSTEKKGSNGKKPKNLQIAPKRREKGQRVDYIVK